MVVKFICLENCIFIWISMNWIRDELNFIFKLKFVYNVVNKVFYYINMVLY